MMMPSSTDQSKSSPAIVEHSASPSGNATVAPDAPIQIDVSLKDEQASSQPPVLAELAVSDNLPRNSRTGDLPSIEEEPIPEPVVAPSAPATAASPAPVQTSPAQAPPIASLPERDRSKVELFYATDRAVILPWSVAYWLPSLISLTIAFVGTVVAVFGFFQWKHKPLWGVAIIGCIALCGIVGTRVTLKYNTAARLVAMGGVIFGGDRNEMPPESVMNYGRALVTLPPNHEVGQIERPNALLFEYKESPDKHVMVRQMHPLEEGEFFSSVDESVQSAREQSVLVFIHGYNVAFEDALLRTAQLSSDLKFDGVPMLYSWPSTGRLTGYLTDEENVEWSVTHLEDLLHNIKTKTKAEQLHVIVHSMGNRALLGAVERLALRYPTMQPMLGQVVLAAPDVDVGQFESRYLVPIHQATKQVTLYTSAGDKALLASATIHKVDRLGLSGKVIRTYQGIDTVDVSQVDTSLLGHSYYGSQETLIKDIRALIELGEPPLKRQWLQEVTGQADPVFWRFAEGYSADAMTTR